MSLRNRLLTDVNTKTTLDYNKWFFENDINKLLGLDIDKSTNINSKDKVLLYSDVNNKTLPVQTNLGDLTRLHFFVRNRRATTILEFGAGSSTVVMADAIAKNKRDYGHLVSKNLRRYNPFEVHSLESSRHWIKQSKKKLPKSLAEYVNFCFSDVEMSTFNDRVCTMYRKLPNICPDLIYLDGPNPLDVKGNVRGISTCHPDRPPIAADILILEYFLLPGTLIIVDGRTSNARFILNNFQRNWEYCHFEEEDISAFELVEKPLGRINQRQMDFTNNRL